MGDRVTVYCRLSGELKRKRFIMGLTRCNVVA